MKPVRIYTTAYCPYCHAAKALLNQEGIAFEEIDAAGDLALRRELVAKTGRRTVPQIFFGEQSIGGFEELRTLEQSGKLAAALKDD